MRERAESDLERFVTTRLVTGLDLLPVPADGHRLPPRTTARGRSNPVLVLAALIAIVAVALAWAPASQAVADAAKLIQRMITGVPYVGYYLDLDARDPNGFRKQRLMFAPGRLPGVPTVPEMIGRTVNLDDLTVNFTSWSADGEHLIVFSGPRLYLGDRAGRVREVAAFAPEYAIVRAAWTGPDDIIAVLGVAQLRDQNGDPIPTLRSRNWIGRVHLGGSPDAPRAIPRAIGDFSGLAFSSPDGRWVAVDRGYSRYRDPGCFELSAVYEIDADRLIDLVDARGRPLMAMGWLGDGRLVTGFCSPSDSTMELFLGAPDSVPSAPLVVLPWRPFAPAPIVDRPRDRILVAPRGGVAATSLIAVDPDGRQTVLGRIPAFTFSATTHAFITDLSRDERYLSVREVDTSGPPWQRTGVIELATGQITDACAGAPQPRDGCLRLTLR